MNYMPMHYSFYIYRLPNSTDTFIYRGEAVKGFLPGFIIAPFDPDILPVSIINEENCEWDDIYRIFDSINADNTNQTLEIFPFPNVSTSLENHASEIMRIKEFINNDSEKKVIASRVIVKEGEIDIRNSYKMLCESMPEAFVFLLYTPYTGCWMGASPELLLKAEKNTLSTYALAGTRKAHDIGKWDSKNINEQAIVKNYIINIFKDNGMNVECSATKTRVAGTVEHLCNEISAVYCDDMDISSFVNDLSPTPALSGYPKCQAIDMIKKLEIVPRGFYGGFLGPYHSSSDFVFYVNLRSLRIKQDRYCMHVGGGITALSDPDEEWVETERKANSILNKIITK